MKVKTTVELNTKAIDTLIEAAQQAHKKATQAILGDVIAYQVVPKDTGKLENSSEVDISDIANGHTAITFDTPYARRLYFHPEYNFHQDKNANAQGNWMQSYIDGDKQDMVREEFAKAFKDNAKEVIK